MYIAVVTRVLPAWFDALPFNRFHHLLIDVAECAILTIGACVSAFSKALLDIFCKRAAEGDVGCCLKGLIPLRAIFSMGPAQ